MEFVFEALLGIQYSAENAVLLFVFLGAGYGFGKLTKSVGLLKGLLVIALGFVFYSILKNAYGAFILAFLLGFISNHINFALEAAMWAEDIGDMIYAYRHREAFEDIREQEQRSGNGESSRWQSDHSSQHRQSQEKKSYRKKSDSECINRKSSRSKKNLYEAHYHTMGLDPNDTYSKSELKKAYRKHALKAHPDTGGSNEAFQKLNAAYSKLIGLK